MHGFRMDATLRTLTDRLRRKLNRTFKHGMVCTLAAMVAVFALPSAAMAEDNYYKTCEWTYVSCQTGVDAGLVQGVCMTASADYASTSVCVDYDGDYVYVRDGKADGYAAMASVNSQKGTVTDRFCRNNHGYGTWVKCNFNWTEADVHQVAGGYKIQFYDMDFEYLWTFSNN